MFPSTRSYTPLAIMLLCVTYRASIAQPPDHTLTKLRGLHLPKGEGRTPLTYAPAVEQRARQYQKALQGAHEWYEERLQLRLPITLAVLDRETFERLSRPPMPYSQFNPGLVVLPSHLENVTSLRPPEVDFALVNEAVAFHEAGHIFANALKIDGGAFVNDEPGLAIIDKLRPNHDK